MPPVWDFVRGSLILAAYTALGFALQKVTHIPFPPPLLGLFALWLSLRLGLVQLAWIDNAGSFLLRHMSLFFLPILLAAPRNLEFTPKNALLFLLVLVPGSILTLLTTRWVAARWLDSPPDIPRPVASAGAPS